MLGLALDIECRRRYPVYAQLQLVCAPYAAMSHGSWTVSACSVLPLQCHTYINSSAPLQSVMIMRLGVAKPLETRKFIVFSRQYLGNTEKEVIELWRTVLVSYGTCC